MTDLEQCAEDVANHFRVCEKLREDVLLALMMPPVGMHFLSDDRLPEVACLQREFAFASAAEYVRCGEFVWLYF